ncbi:hypothetical protein [Novosphingobium naphthalenivorans]|uniref:hypothetical protein n=1 Tax=Novosphingobium naphthalenivorans TaxID=273168 RepID=UPI00082F8EF3|nr:hypothetical protein [Novosphingobium naphthalenivorans]
MVLRYFRERFNWRRALIVFVVIQSCLMVERANSQALAKAAGAGRFNNAVTRVIMNRAKRMGFAANDNVVNATLSGLGAAGTDLAISAGAAIAFGTPIGWGSIILGGLAVGAITYFGLNSGFPSIQTRYEGNGTVLGSPDTQNFGNLRLSANTTPSQASQGIYQLTFNPASIKFDQVGSGNTYARFVNVGMDADQSPAAGEIQYPVYKNVICVGQVEYSLVVCLLNFINKQVDLRGRPGAGHFFWDQSQTGWVIKRAAYQDPNTGVVYPAITQSLSFFDSTKYTASNGGVAINNVGRNDQAQPVAMKSADTGSNFIPTIPTLGYEPYQSDAWYYFSQLPTSRQSQEVNPDVVADTANKLWQAAAQTPGYNGLPYSINDPITHADAEAVRVADPAAWPQVADLADPLFNAGDQPSITFPDNVNIPTDDPATIGDPALDPAPNANPISDLGGDPGIAQPTLDDAPTWAEIADPLFTWFPAIGSLDIPGGTCPTDSFDWNGETFTLDQHCQFFEDWRSVIGAAMIAVWTMAACVVILRA